MNKVQRCRKAIKQLCFAYIPQINLLFIRNYSIEGDLSINVTKDKRQSKKTESANFEQISQFSKDQVENNLVIPRQDTFASLLRHSKFIDVNMKYFITLHYCITLQLFFYITLHFIIYYIYFILYNSTFFFISYNIYIIVFIYVNHISARKSRRKNSIGRNFSYY